MNGNDAGALIGKHLKRRLAACVAAVFGLSSSSVFATVFVTNCNDSGQGSLRTAIASAPDGAEIDASGLKGVCSTITLKTGEIKILQDDLTIVGPGPNELSVTAKYGTILSGHQYKSRIFNHAGSGTLHLKDIAANFGYVQSTPAYGGCIYSSGAVTLENTYVLGCTAHSAAASSPAKGGGVFAQGYVYMLKSAVSFSSAEGGSQTAGYGGGIYAFGLTANYSQVASNLSTNEFSTTGFSGGASLKSVARVYGSTIAMNEATTGVGGLSATYAIYMVNSTVSSNIARNGFVGGMYSFGKGGIYNSTIANNTAAQALPTLAVGAGFANKAVTLESTIVAGNRYGSPPSSDNDISAYHEIGGHNNLIVVTSASVPPDTLIGKCPLLGKLQLNGGFTQTHRLLSRSPAIDAGNNMRDEDYDQRGSKRFNGERDYQRVSSPSGVTPRADIGAYEVDRADEIFVVDFDGC